MLAKMARVQEGGSGFPPPTGHVSHSILALESPLGIRVRLLNQWQPEKLKLPPFNSVGEKTCVECYLPNCDLNSDNMPGQVKQALTSGSLKHEGCTFQF